METGIRVHDLMTRNPVCVNKNTSLKECAEIMEKESIGSLLILGNDNELHGIITEQDIVRKAVAKNLSSETQIKNIAETRVNTITPDKDVFTAIKIMADNNIRHLPVMDENSQELLGLVTLKDILKIQPQLFELLVDKIELKEQENKLSLVDDEL